MPARRFIQCDVFTPIPTLGNALAVVVDGEGVTEEAMRRFAAWTNLAETTFKERSRSRPVVRRLAKADMRLTGAGVRS